MCQIQRTFSASCTFDALLLLGASGVILLSASAKLPSHSPRLLSLRQMPPAGRQSRSCRSPHDTCAHDT